MSEQVAVKISKQLFQRAEQLASLRKQNVIDIIEQAVETAIATELSAEENGWNILMESIETYQVDTGISDLADQHDHYLYGKPKTIDNHD